MTQLREDVPKELRGTYRGLAAPAMIEHLQKLAGVRDTFTISAYKAFTQDQA